MDYADTFIAVAEDCPVAEGHEPAVKPENPSVAARTYQMIAENPYGFTSGDVIFTVHADRHGIPEQARAAARAEFYAKPRACLRSSDLAKRYGWGIHADADCRLALYGVDSPQYAELAAGLRPTASGGKVAVVPAMRNSRAR